MKHSDIGKPNWMYLEMIRREGIEARKKEFKRRVFLVATLALFLLALVAV